MQAVAGHLRSAPVLNQIPLVAPTSFSPPHRETTTPGCKGSLTCREQVRCGTRAIPRMRRVNPITLMLLAALGGCSLWMETKRPDYTDVGVVQKGTPRQIAAAVFGRPLQTYQKDGKDVDVFQADPNGRYGGTKAAITSFNAVADVLSIGMWEAVASPAEFFTRHKLTTYVVTYGKDQSVESIETVAAPPKLTEQIAAAVSSTNASPDAAGTPSSDRSPVTSGSPTVAGSPTPAPNPSGTTTPQK